MEQELRKQAIERYLKGESPKSIYRDLDRVKNWFFKWLKRYQSGEPNWCAQVYGVMSCFMIYY
jgi:transposase-like protein